MDPHDPRLEPIRFFLPGPAYVPECVRQCLTRPVMGHRSPAFRAIYASLAERLPRILRTRGEVYIASCSSTLMMEAALISTLAPGETVLHLTCGAFSERWHAVSRALGRSAEALAVPWGQAVTPGEVRAALRRRRYAAVTLVHNETSTGVIHPVAEIAQVVREESDALLLLDAVSSLGGAPVETDAWGADLVLAGVQKGLALPPGLVLVTFSERLAARAAAVPHRGFYTDLLRYRDKHREGGPITTPVVSLVYALDFQVDRVLAEGLEERWARHARLAADTAAWAAERGFVHAAAAGVRSPTVTCLRCPPPLTPARLLAGLEQRGFTVGGGYGQWKGETFRIGHMGEVRASDLAALLAAIDEVTAALV